MLVFVNLTLFLMCLAANVLGLYGSIVEIQGHSASTRPFPCKSNELNRIEHMSFSLVDKPH